LLPAGRPARVRLRGRGERPVLGALPRLVARVGVHRVRHLVRARPVGLVVVRVAPRVALVPVAVRARIHRLAPRAHRAPTARGRSVARRAGRRRRWVQLPRRRVRPRLVRRRLRLVPRCSRRQ
jgi:hypothetical protein